MVSGCFRGIEKVTRPDEHHQGSLISLNVTYIMVGVNGLGWKWPLIPFTLRFIYCISAGLGMGIRMQLYATICRKRFHSTI